MTDVLKDALQFDGFVVSDWNGYQQTASDHAEACARAVNAGVDMLMVGEDWRRVYSDLLQQAVAGRVPMARIDDAVARILRVKGRAGLFAAKPPSVRPGAGGATALGCPQHRQLARRAVRESLVMLKNDTGLLPLDRDLKVLVAGDGAHDIGKQCGGWTLTWQGTGNRNEDFPNGNSVFDGIVEAVADHGSVALRPDGDFAGDDAPDVAIVVFGENPYAEGDGDRAHLSYSAEHPQPVAILRRLKARGISTVAVFLTGRPMWVNPELNASDAFVVAWPPGTEGGGVADVLFRGAGGRMDDDFRGTLSFSWPGHALHAPLNVGDADYAPLFPYGFGLRYADPATRLPKRPEQDTASGLPAEDLPRRASSTHPR